MCDSSSFPTLWLVVKSIFPFLALLFARVDLFDDYGGERSSSIDYIC